MHSGRANSGETSKEFGEIWKVFSGTEVLYEVSFQIKYEDFRLSLLTAMSPM